MENEGKLEDKTQYLGLLMPVAVLVMLYLIFNNATKL